MMLSIDTNEISQPGTEEVNVCVKVYAAFTVLRLLQSVRWLAVVEEKGAFVSNEAQLRARVRVLF